MRQQCRTLMLVGVIALFIGEVFLKIVTTLLQLESESAGSEGKKKEGCSQQQGHDHGSRNDPPIFTIDAISIGSNSRPDFAKAQHDTWGSRKNGIRKFYAFDETNTSESCHSHTEAARATCGHPDHKIRGTPSYITKDHYFVDRNLGWRCAQKRPTLGLQMVLKEYSKGLEQQRGCAASSSSSILPDWLMIADDDFYFDVELFQSLIPKMAKRIRQDPSMSSHLPSSLDRMSLPWGLTAQEIGGFGGKPNHVTFAYGGAGIVINKAFIQALMTPLQCDGDGDANGDADGNLNTTTATTDLFDMSHACAMLRRNEAGEAAHYKRGMDLATLMAAMAEKREPFCYHSDWFFGYMTSNYFVKHMQQQQGEKRSPINSSFLPLIEMYSSCKPNFCQPSWNDLAVIPGICKPGQIVCHFMNPQKLHQRHNSSHF